MPAVRRRHTTRAPLPTRSAPNKQRRQAYFFLLVNTITWGAALVVVKPALEITTAYRYLFWRFILAGLLVIPIVWHYWRQLPPRQRWQSLGTIIAHELIGTTAALGFLYLGLAQTTAVEASLLTTAVPVFVTVGGIIWLREKQQLNEWLGLAMAVVGTIALTLIPLAPRLLNPLEPFHPSLIGNLLVLGHNVSMAAYLLLAKRSYARLPKLFVSGVSFYVGAISFALLSWWESGWASWADLQTLARADLTSWPVLVAVVYMAVFGSIIGLTAYIKGQSQIEASEASWFWYLQPAVFVPLAYVWLRETTSWPQLIALALIIAGVWLAERRTKRLKT